MRNILIVAPHADDESLGCGGSILRFIDEGCQVSWLIVTGMSLEAGFSIEQIERRKKEIEKVTMMYQFSNVIELNLPPAALDTLPKGDIIAGISKVIKELEPQDVYTVYRNDVHSDHEMVFDAVASATKSFRYPFIERIFAYETISETDYGLKPEDSGFRPNVFVNISDYIDRKLKILNVFESEMGIFPFPRSAKAIEALAIIRGSQANCNAAESFMLLKEIVT
ncbi:MAG: PIG-L deacetylase family protein [Colwellia sp.]